MRFLTIIATLAGIGGAGFLAYKWQGEINHSIELAIELAKANSGGNLAKGNAAAHKLADDALQAKIAYIQRDIYGLFAAIPVGVVGAFLAFRRKRLLAALTLLIAYGIPLGLLVYGAAPQEVEKERLELAKLAALYAAGLPTAALLSLFIHKPIPYKKPKRKKGISMDDDIVG